jgi:CDP-glucose 4,6-dehydratase
LEGVVMFSDCYRGKKVVVTGHTGFKGTWLSRWLTLLGAEVMGISNEVPTQPSMFEILELEKTMDHRLLDVRDAKALAQALHEFKPDCIFHLAAQAIVSVSYDDPLGTISTNAMGTAHVLDAVRQFTHPCQVVIVTSDKCYENVEWEWGYKETDHLGGKDIYSASKAATEVIFHAYFHSFLQEKNNIRVASARAGNVIGGGDWATNRIVVDAVLSWDKQQPVAIRSPEATRPWQHVLEPLSGYLWLGAQLATDDRLNGESFNFGPRAEQNHRVIKLIADVFQHWQGDFPCYEITGNTPFYEAGLLKLNCDKSLFYLKWQPTLTYDECVEFVGEWYAGYYQHKSDIQALTLQQLEAYIERATNRGNAWT